MNRKLQSLISIMVVLALLSFSTMAMLSDIEKLDEAAVLHCTAIGLALSLINQYAVRPYLYSIFAVKYYSSRPGTDTGIKTLKTLLSRTNSKQTNNKKKNKTLYKHIYFILASMFLINRMEFILLILVLCSRYYIVPKFKKDFLFHEVVYRMILPLVGNIQFMGPLEKYLKVRIKQFDINGNVKVLGLKNPCFEKNNFRSAGFFCAHEQKIQGEIL